VFDRLKRGRERVDGSWVKTDLNPRHGHSGAFFASVCALVVVGALAAAPAGAATLTTTMTIAASGTQPLVGERVVLSAQFSPQPLEATMSFFDDGAPVAGCTNLRLDQRCWIEYASPGAHTITATMIPSTFEEEEFGVKYELGEAPRSLTLTAVPRGTSCAGGSCATRLSATGAPQSWTVPAGVSRATFVLRGAGGGPGSSEEASNDEGGAGGKVTATLPVTEGETFSLVLGEPGVEASEHGVEVPGGYGGGGNGGLYGEFGDGSGGGGSFLFAPAGPLLLAAGGGGGAGNLAPGGNGGQTGANGGENGVSGGTGASATGPGLGGEGGQNGFGPTVTTAVEGRGGHGANGSPQGRSGGGGGGGYYGGGGGGINLSGGVSGGGGGSDYVAPTASGVIYEDGAGGAGGEDAADPGQPGSAEILYAPTSAAGAPAGSSPAGQQPTGVKTLPGLHLTVYTHGGQGLINTHALTVKASCGPVACQMEARAAVHISGLSRRTILLGSTTSTAANSVGRVVIGVPVALRRLLRPYLLRHPRTRIQVALTVTAIAGASHETFAETLPMWTLRGFR